MIKQAYLNNHKLIVSERELYASMVFYINIIAGKGDFYTKFVKSILDPFSQPSFNQPLTGRFYFADYFKFYGIFSKFIDTFTQNLRFFDYEFFVFFFLGKII